MNKKVIDEENKEIEIKETQGQKKVRQYIDDLLRNNQFTLTIKKLLIAGTKVKNSKDDTDELYEIIKEYRKLDTKAGKYERQHFAEQSRLLNMLAEEYGLDNELLRPVMITHSSLKDGELQRICLLIS